MAPDQLELPPSDCSRPEALAFVVINVEDDLSPKALMISIYVRNITSIYRGDFSPPEMEGHMLKESVFFGNFLEYLAKYRTVANQSDMKSNL